MGGGQSRLDLAATALCADRPLLPQQGSVYWSQLARMRPRCNSWELGSDQGHKEWSKLPASLAQKVMLSHQRVDFSLRYKLPR